MSLIHIVFDFDCTLTAYHLYHTMHSGDEYLNRLMKQDISQWDDRSKRVLTRILKSEAAWDRGEDGGYGHVPGLLSSVPSFTTFIFGGMERIDKLKKMLYSLSSLPRVVLHISTKGIISDVVAMFQNLNIIHHFQLIDGFDDLYKSKMCYYIGKGFIQNTRTFYDRASNLQGRSNATQFGSKPDFIKSLLISDKDTTTGHIIYLDDDPEYYSQLTQTFPDNVLCLDIGNKEGIYSTGIPNVTDVVMFQLLQVVAKYN